jgi:hypothetical protein
MVTDHDVDTTNAMNAIQYDSVTVGPVCQYLSGTVCS